MRAFSIGLTSLRRLLADRTSFFFTAALPVIIIVIVGQATAGFQNGAIPVQVAGAEHGPLAAELVEQLDANPSISVEEVDDPEEVRRSVRRWPFPVGVIIPPHYDETVRGAGTASVEFVLDVTRGDPAATRSLVAAVVERQAATAQAARFTASETGTPFEEALTLAHDLTPEIPRVEIASETLGEREETLVGGFDYTTPAMLVLFVFITTLGAGAMLIESRHLGVTRRMLSTPTRTRTVLAGETLGRFTIGAAQAGFILVIGSLLFGVVWGDPLAAVLLVLLFVLVATAAAMLLGTLLHNAEQAGAIAPPVGIALGMLGGCMWPLEIVPTPMRVFGHLFPHAWAMDAWIELVGRGGGVADIALELGVLAGYAAVLLPLATWRLRRAIVR